MITEDMKGLHKRLGEGWTIETYWFEASGEVRVKVTKGTDTEYYQIPQKYRPTDKYGEPGYFLPHTFREIMSKEWDLGPTPSILKKMQEETEKRIEMAEIKAVHARLRAGWSVFNVSQLRAGDTRFSIHLVNGPDAYATALPAHYYPSKAGNDWAMPDKFWIDNMDTVPIDEVFSREQNQELTKFYSETRKHAFHTREIPEGQTGEFSKITEEYHEALDAFEQGNTPMLFIELADVLGAIERYLTKNHPSVTFESLVKMMKVNRAAFASGKRPDRDNTGELNGK